MLPLQSDLLIPCWDIFGCLFLQQFTPPVLPAAKTRFWFWDAESFFTNLGQTMAENLDWKLASWYHHLRLSSLQGISCSQALFHFLPMCEVIVFIFWCYKWRDWGGKIVNGLFQIAVGTVRLLESYYLKSWRTLIVFSLCFIHVCVLFIWIFLLASRFWFLFEFITLSYIN